MTVRPSLVTVIMLAAAVVGVIAGWRVFAAVAGG